MAGFDLRSALHQRHLVAIVRGRDATASIASLHTLAEEGVALAEVSLSASEPWRVIESARAELGGGDLSLGVGTVLTADDTRRAASLGADFIVTPAATEGADEARRLGLPLLAGAHSPSEVLAAHLAGAAAVKLFPASLGGPAYLTALRDPFPQIGLVPVGGVAIESVGDYLRAGAVAVGLGSPLLGDAPHGGDLLALRVRARRVLAEIAELDEIDEPPGRQPA